MSYGVVLFFGSSEDDDGFGCVIESRYFVFMYSFYLWGILDRLVIDRL